MALTTPSAPTCASLSMSGSHTTAENVPCRTTSKSFKLDFPFRCPLLATTRHLTSVYPELESLISFYMVKEGVVPTFRDHGAHTKASLAALKRACETVWELRRGRAPIVPSPEARAGGVHTPAASEQPSIPASDPDAGSEDYESDSSDGLFVTDIRELITEERLKYDLKKANKEIVEKDKFINWQGEIIDERDTMIMDKNRRIREQRQERIAADSRRAKIEFKNIQRMALEVNNLERHVGKSKRENAHLWRDNQVLLDQAQKAERALEQAKADLQRRGGPTKNIWDCAAG
ncbi:hypothetical protein SLS60_005042 [Paraconiothyrium brasiliense]|uniref:Uncharacterized protein n=1 Tax=Paraconiothyrium brasiliense TaxID=300254 RepID=A0ABR3RG83_9PLEO